MKRSGDDLGPMATATAIGACLTSPSGPTSKPTWPSSIAAPLPATGSRPAAVAVVVIDSDSDRHAATIPTRPANKRWRCSPATAASLCPAAWPARPAARRSSSPGGLPGSTPTPASGRCPAVGSTGVRPPSMPPSVRLHEEIGLDLDPTALMGVLDDYPTRSGFVITPLVFWAGGAVDQSDIEIRP